MKIEPEHILKTIRSMAWARVKGELDSILSTYWSSDGSFEAMKELIDEFIKKVEDDGCID